MMKMTTGKRFGIELEFDGNTRTIPELQSDLKGSGWTMLGGDGYARAEDSSNTTGWQIKTDASVSGNHPMEIATPVLDGEDGLSKYLKFNKYLTEKDCKVNNSCGLHVHREAIDLSDREFVAIYQNYVNFERMIDLMLPPRRRTKPGNNYCKALTKLPDKKIFTLKRGITEIAKHSTIGFASYPMRGTIEFRHAHGTFEEEFVVNWWLFIDSLFRTAGKTPFPVKDEYLHTPKIMTKHLGLPEDTFKYFQKIYNKSMKKAGIGYFDITRKMTSSDNSDLRIDEEYNEVIFNDDGTPQSPSTIPNLNWGPNKKTKKKIIEKVLDGIPDEYFW
jgi:hypothetical protein